MQSGLSKVTLGKEIMARRGKERARGVYGLAVFPSAVSATREGAARGQGVVVLREKED